MALKILHETVRQNLPVDVSSFKTAEEFLESADIINLKEGRFVSLDTNGNIKLADGETDVIQGALVQPVKGLFLENPAALASGKVAVTYGKTIALTDQYVSSITFAVNDPVYVGTGANKGLLTNTATNAGIVGYVQEAPVNAGDYLKVAFESIVAPKAQSETVE